jgi:hypothetical protein
MAERELKALVGVVRVAGPLGPAAARLVAREQIDLDRQARWRDGRDPRALETRGQDRAASLGVGEHDASPLPLRRGDPHWHEIHRLRGPWSLAIMAVSVVLAGVLFQRRS